MEMAEWDDVAGDDVTVCRGWGRSWFYSVCPSKCRDSTLNYATTVSTSLPIHLLLTILPLYATELWTASLNVDCLVSYQIGYCALLIYVRWSDDEDNNDDDDGDDDDDNDDNNNDDNDDDNDDDERLHVLTTAGWMRLLLVKKLPLPLPCCLILHSAR
jgi:hypothetical protein